MEKKNVAKKIFNIAMKIINSILWTAIIVTSILLIIIVVSKKTEVFGHRMYVIMSGSMEPTIMTKDAIITKHIDEPKEGDVIAFENSDIITVHRITRIEEQGNQKLYQTKGDNNNTIDKGLVKQEQIKGRVQYVIPHLGGVILFLQTNVIYIVFAILIILVFTIARRMIFSENDTKE